MWPDNNTESKAATFRPAYPQHAGSNYPQGILRVAQAIFQRKRVVRGYQIFGLFLEIRNYMKYMYLKINCLHYFLNLDSEFSTIS